MLGSSTSTSSGSAQPKGPATSMSLDASNTTGNTKGSASRGGRSKVHQALAIAASINRGDMQGIQTGGGAAPTTGAPSGARGGNSRNTNAGNSNGGSRSNPHTTSAPPPNSQASTGGSDKDGGGGDYEGSKGHAKTPQQSRREAEEMRQMVADLDRFDANDENDNLDDSF